jgi:tripartite motif-containing protein 71
VIGVRAEGVLRFPEAVAVGPQGDVYVADQLSFVVQKFTPTGQLEAEWGSYGAGAGQFGPIGGVATDGDGNVYVVDSSHNRIEKFNSSGGFISDWGSTGVDLGEFRFGSSTTPSQPPGGGIAVAGSYVYVADTDNHRIERFDLDGGNPIQWGSPGVAPGEFRYPHGVAANAGEVLVADDDNHRIEQFDPNGAFLGAVGSNGAGPQQFAFPYGVALDAAGNAYVSDNNNHRIVKLSPTLAFSGAWGSFGSAPGQFEYPRAIASDPAGTMYVADTANSRIEVFDSNGVLLRSWGLPGRSGGILTAPRGVVTDPTGRLLVSDSSNNRVELFAPGSDTYAGDWEIGGALLGGTPTLNFAGPQGLAIDPFGYVYVADTGNQRFVRLWGDGTFLDELGDGSGAQLDSPSAVAVGGSGTVYVADTNNNRVMVYGSTGSLLAKWGAGGGDGQAGSNDGEFDTPTALAVDLQGDVYVADSGNDRIQKLSPDGGFLAQWGVRGGRDGRFRTPTAVAVDAQRRVYVVDNGNNRVQVFDASGRFLAKWGVRGAVLGEFSQPTAIAVDCAGAVYVADTNNNRVQRFTPLSPGPSSCAAPGSWPPPLNVAPKLNVALPRVAGVLARRGVALTVSCDRGCRVLITATVATRKPYRTFGLVAVARPLPARRTGHVRLRIAPTALVRLRKALGRHVGMLATVTIVAAGPTGRRTTLHRSYAVRR